MLVKQSFLVLISCGISACISNVEQVSDPEFAASSTGSDCIFEGTIRDYRILDESNLLVTASARRQYHIELTRRAYGLKSSWHIGFTSPGSRICGGFSEIIVDDSFGPEAIRIRSIHRLSPEEYENMLIRFGKKEPEIEQTREPEEIEGAEVEELD